MDRVRSPAAAGRRRRAVLATLGAVLTAAPPVGSADPAPCGAALEARFVESAPRDRFEFVNGSGGGASVSDVSLDLTGSAGELIFDTVEGGTGVEVFQPFRVEAGEALLATSRLPSDGGERVELGFEGFVPGERFAFSIDVDDRLASSELGQIRVAGGEIEGARLSVSFVGAEGERVSRTATFGADGRVTVVIEACDG